MNFTKRQKDILDYHRKHPEATHSHIKGKFNANYYEIERILDHKVGFDNLEILQNLIAPKLSDRKKFKNIDCIITADYHCPAVDLRMVDYVIESAKEFKTDILLIAGDYFNFDAMSSYAKKMGGDEKLPKLSHEIMIGHEVLNKLSKVFREIWYFAGNHEKRFAKAVNNALSFEVVAKTLEVKNLKIVNQYSFYLDDIFIAHPKNYSIVKLAVATRLSNVNVSPVMQAHGHFMGFGFGVAGEDYPIIDLGCMCDPERIPYANEEPTTHPKWNRGYWIYKNKQLYPRANRFGLTL